MRRLMLLCLLAITPAASFAVPISYDLTYTSDYGPSGVGSAIWDADTNDLSEFTWDLGVGRVGGVLTSFLSRQLFSSTYGAVLWEAVTGDHAASSEESLPLHIEGSDRAFGYGASYGMSFVPVGLYNFTDARYESITGVVGTTVRSTGGVSVPEPASLAMFALGLFGLALARRGKR